MILDIQYVHFFDFSDVLIIICDDDSHCFFFNVFQASGVKNQAAQWLNSTGLRIRCWTVLRRGNGQGDSSGDRVDAMIVPAAFSSYDQNAVRCARPCAVKST